MWGGGGELPSSLHRNENLAFLFFCLPRSRIKFAFPHAHVPKMPGTRERGSARTRKQEREPISDILFVQNWQISSFYFKEQ